jgi:hypothetical protein
MTVCSVVSPLLVAALQSYRLTVPKSKKVMHQIEQSSEIMGFQITSASQFPTKK